MAQSTPDPTPLRVTKTWRASYNPALAVLAGDIVTLGRRDTEYPGWQWAINAAGLGGWIPETILSGSRITGDFDTQELSIRQGDLVTRVASRAGWIWCRTKQGAEGWLPENHLTPL